MHNLFWSVMAISVFSSFCVSGEVLMHNSQLRFSFPASSVTMPATLPHNWRLSKIAEFLPSHTRYYASRIHLKIHGISHLHKRSSGSRHTNQMQRRTNQYFPSSFHTFALLHRGKRKPIYPYTYQRKMPSSNTYEIFKQRNIPVPQGGYFTTDVHHRPYSYSRRKRFPASLRYSPALDDYVARPTQKRHDRETSRKFFSLPKFESHHVPFESNVPENDEHEKRDEPKAVDTTGESSLSKTGKFRINTETKDKNIPDSEQKARQNQYFEYMSESELLGKDDAYRRSLEETGLKSKTRKERANKASLTAVPNEQVSLQRQEMSHHSMRMAHRLYVPNLNKTALLYFARTPVPTMSHALHRIMRKYYYLVIRLSLRMKSKETQMSFFKSFNDKILKLLENLLQLRSNTDDPLVIRSNWYLRMMMERVRTYNSNPYPPREIPFRDHLVAGSCVAYVAYQEFPILNPHHHYTRIKFRVNVGPLSEVVWRQWRDAKCLKFFENAFKHQIPYSDDDGMNILAPRVKEEDQIYIRGPTVYTMKQCFDDRQMMTFYRCQMMKMTTVKLKEERECYFKQFHKNMLVTVQDLYNKSGASLPPAFGRIQNWLHQRHRRTVEKSSSRSTSTARRFTSPWDANHKAVMNDMADLLSRKTKNLNKTKVLRADTVFRRRVKAVGTELETDIGGGDSGFWTYDRILLIYYSIMIALLLLLCIVFGYSLMQAYKRKRSMQHIYSEFRYSSALTDPKAFKD